MILTLLTLLVIYATGKLLFSIFISLYHHFRTLNLKAKYGSGWAIVTGATDGIGFGFCQQLAKQGYNICLISRSGQKLQRKIQQLRTQFGQNIKYKAITADFKNGFSVSFFQQIQKQLEQIQPTILVNNVGISQITLIKDQSKQCIQDLISINCLAQSNLTSYFIKRCEKQNRKGGIINISSYSWVIPMPYMSVYAATKAFNDVLSRCTAEQTKNVDILSVRAMEVISSNVKKQKSMTVCTSRQCAYDSLKYLGRTKVTSGHIKHELTRHLTDALPYWLVHKFAMTQAKRVYEEYGSTKKD